MDVPCIVRHVDFRDIVVMDIRVRMPQLEIENLLKRFRGKNISTDRKEEEVPGRRA